MCEPYARAPRRGKVGVLISASGPVKVRHDPGAVDVEAELEGAQTPSVHALDDAAPIGGPDIKHEEAAAARAHELASDRARSPSDFVVFVDGRVGHLGSDFALLRPVRVQE